MDLQIASIETERLVIRPFELSDYENWYKGFSDRSPSLYKYDEGRPITMEHNTRERFEKWIRGFAEAAMKDQMTNLGIFRKKDGLNVGKVELFTILRMDYQWGMMGYSLHNQFWKKGYATEAVSAAAEIFHEKLGFHRLELHINTDNRPSISLAERSGFHYEGTRKKFAFENGEWTDFLIYVRYF
ncbi:MULTISPECIES: GNAT family N-acetyltransferase [Bacillus]|uniref:GNAT family acetyltransferase n=2 Tax=Bacillus infantis TaxID=324767 RepID=U5LDJ1_9BACI|nr:MULTISPECIES: GNAT family N-acetyltransferase [Bacillus]AGX04751.1 GNAT family acetyltransferase [Bacillus infantis NRRL B-14911]EAR68168.1 possible acetyltransferase, GNAT family protein [Bacillus sp. NRRL B-14911]MCP1158843.1 GNAT family N-acetyltransferase [Bacillus infantis]TYS64926.1 GNAT family N-acetyltransferase [Bacillus infantis]